MLLHFQNSIKYILLTLLVAVPIFGFLDTMPIRTWDEARIAINAQAMYHDGDYIVTHYYHDVETWNTKPPLLIWFQVFLMKLIGQNEIAIRLPVALAVFGTCLALLFFSLRYLKNFWIGFITILLLITSDGFMRTHVGRTGDYDGLLTLFTTTGCLFFFAFTETKKNKFLYLFFASVTLGVLTKGVAGLLFFPALGIYVLLQKQVPAFLKNKHFYSGLASSLFFVLGYYLLRESQDPGYIKIVQENELGGRYMVAQGNQKFDFWYYLNNLRTYHLPDRYLLIPCGLLVGSMSQDNRLRKLSLFMFLLILIYFLIISAAKTKMDWYDAPLYPFLSIAIALIIHFFFSLLKNSEWINRTLRYNVVPYLLLFLLLITPYQRTWSRTYLPEEIYWDHETYEIGYYLKSAIKGKYDLNGKCLVYDGYSAQNIFYLKVLNDKGVKVSYKDFYKIKEGDLIIACQDVVKNHIRENFIYEEQRQQGVVSLFTIHSLKETQVPGQ